jgi:cytochrome c biogenesis protein CcmG, thiol:disulfide interchange protein DsbE
MSSNRAPAAPHAAVNSAGKRRAALAVAFALMLLAATYRPALAADSLSPGAGKVVLVDFWASWCEPCRHSFPWMNEMQKKYAHDRLVIVAVNVDNDRAAAERFLDENPTELEIRYDDDRLLARRFEVVAMPSSFLLDENGEVVERHLGFKVLKQDEYEAAIKAALGKE